ncbi:MAG: ABC transporter permease [Paeniglutamicibacter sp.]|jgi:peptide/nickel transport system permease protein|uniref:ABC transporter permease n=1 Tax=Arthrobacter sp. UCD-GKA TaxID=1913576 RepID=UPI0009F682B6|nr:ABC transporter permease [Arthrobacter sp. UCD-GKA]
MPLLILRRLGSAVLTIVLASLLVFLAIQALPGDVVQQILGRDATPEAVAQMRSELGLDTPVFLRYVQWLFGALQGDFGSSLVSGEPVGPNLLLHFRNTLLIAVPTVIISVTLSIVLGVVAGLRRGKWADHSISLISLLAMSIPEFMVAALLVLAFAVGIPLFPAVVLDGPQATLAQLLPSIWLPVIVLSLAMAAYIIRMTRTSTIDVMTSEFITTAELKGLRRARVVMRHALPTALLPTLNVVAINIAWMLGGVVVVENIFNYPGMGNLMLEAVFNRDLPVIEAIAVVSAAIYVACNLLADLTAMALDPRQRLRPRARRRAGAGSGPKASPAISTVERSQP